MHGCRWTLLSRIRAGRGEVCRGSCVEKVGAESGRRGVLPPLHLYPHVSYLLHQLRNKLILLCHSLLSHHDICEADLFIVVAHVCICVCSGEGICGTF